MGVYFVISFVIMVLGLQPSTTNKKGYPWNRHKLRTPRGNDWEGSFKIRRSNNIADSVKAFAE